MKKNNHTGFTLVELIIVITILAILASISFVSFSGYISKSRDTKRVSDLSQIEKSILITQVTNFKAPYPANYVTYTGTVGDLYMGTFNSKIVGNMSSEVIDPSTGEEYLYATYDDGKYFQLGGFGENEISLNIGNTTYADNNYAIVKGNYLFDPSLPSLLILSGSTSIYNPNNCFILNGGTNNLNSQNCVKKTDLNLSNYDNGILGYWDMETLTSSGTLKDLSGNGYNGIFTGTLIYNNSITGSLIGKGLNFINNSKIRLITFELPDNFSMVFNVKPNKRPESDDDQFFFHIGAGDGFGGESELNIGYIDYDNMYFRPFIRSLINNSTQGELRIVDKRKNINEGEWNQVTFLFKNGNYYKLYLNGNLLLEHKVYDFDLSNIQQIATIGGANRRIYSGYRSFYGIMDDLKIYNRILSENEIKQQSDILR